MQELNSMIDQLKVNEEKLLETQTGNQDQLSMLTKTIKDLTQDNLNLEKEHIASKDLADGLQREIDEMKNQLKVFQKLRETDDEKAVEQQQAAIVQPAEQAQVVVEQPAADGEQPVVVEQPAADGEQPVVVEQPAADGERPVVVEQPAADGEQPVVAIGEPDHNEDQQAGAEEEPQMVEDDH
jgi:peptidoglycan hydrolase CwlO-like protein